MGVNLSPEQVKYCQRQRLCRCTAAPIATCWKRREWHGQFDGVIANGSLEHWVQPEDVQAGRMNSIYRESFAIAHKVLDPSAPSSLRNDGHSCETRRQAGVSVDAVASPTQGLGSPALQPAPPLDGRLLSGGRTVGRVCATRISRWLAEMDGTVGYQDRQRLSDGQDVSRLVHQPQVGLAHCSLPGASPVVTRTMIRVLLHRAVLGLAVSGARSADEALAPHLEAEFTRAKIAQLRCDGLIEDFWGVEEESLASCRAHFHRR